MSERDELVARLRTISLPTAYNAIVQIEALEAENQRLREALHKIATAPAWGYPDRWETTLAEVRQLARAALSNMREEG